MRAHKHSDLDPGLPSTAYRPTKGDHPLGIGLTVATHTAPSIYLPCAHPHGWRPSDAEEGVESTHSDVQNSPKRGS